MSGREGLGNVMKGTEEFDVYLFFFWCPYMQVFSCFYNVYIRVCVFVCLSVCVCVKVKGRKKKVVSVVSCCPDRRGEAGWLVGWMVVFAASTLA